VNVSTSILESAEVVESFDDLGVLAFTTSRAVGSLGTGTDEPVREVMARWSALRTLLGGCSARLATATQVHGNRVIEHLSTARGTAMAVTVADCVPVFLAHPSGATAALHSGWRGTAARITEQALVQFRAHGLASSEFRLHCGPAICGKCYEVSASVYAELTGRDPGKPTTIDLRALIADHARLMGVKQISVSPLCTRCDNDRFYSHRAGDAGRQLGVIVAKL